MKFQTRKAVKKCRVVKRFMDYMHDVNGFVKRHFSDIKTSQDWTVHPPPICVIK